MYKEKPGPIQVIGPGQLYGLVADRVRCVRC